MTINMRFALVLLIGWLVQAVIVPLLAVGTVQPDLVLILVCAFAILKGPVPGAVGGFLGGLMQDMLVAGNVGLGAVVKTAMGYLAGGADRSLIGDNPLIPAAIIAGISLLSQTAYMGMLFLAGEPIEFSAQLRMTVIPSALYTAAVGLVLFPALSGWLGAERRDTVY